jgi:hypothetical protein
MIQQYHLKTSLTTRSGQRRLRKTTQGWGLLVAWKDGTESWVRLATLKDSYPVKLTEFDKARGIENEPAFAWWVPNTIRRRNAILSAVKARFQKRTHKFGIELPASINHARELDEVQENHLWMETLPMEMFNIGIAFEVLEVGASAPKGRNKAIGHIIWDVKMNYTRKARWVLDGHKQADPEVCAADIRNAYLQAPSSNKDYIICGPELRIEREGKVALIHRALYGGKSAGRD